MASKKNFSITTPRGSVFTEVTANGSVQARLEWNPSFARTKAENFSKAQEFVDSECLRYMNPLTPRRTGMMIKSATLGTVIGSGYLRLEKQQILFAHSVSVSSIFLTIFLEREHTKRCSRVEPASTCA